MNTSISRYHSFKTFRALAFLLVGLSSLEARPVDTELVILVDGQTFSEPSFDLILDGVAQAFEQQSFIDSVTSGPFGTIAASVLVFGSTGTTTAVPWLEISSASDSQSFADSVRNITSPPSFGLISYVDAISQGVASIASSTVEGTFRQLSIIEDGSFFLFSDTEAEVQAARDAALASEVDLINSVVFNAGLGGLREAAIQDYYDDNVVSGGLGGEADVIGGSVFGAPNEAITTVIQDNIVENLTQPTIDANDLSVVPEPSIALLGLLSSSLLLFRRRRSCYR